MVKVNPFSAIHPRADLAEQIAVLPYDVVDSKEAAAFAEGNPYSYFRIDRSEIELPELASPYDPKVYEKAAANLQKFLAEGWFVEDGEPTYYLYELTMNGRSQTGIVATTSIQEYLDGKIKKHEFTRPEKEQDRMNHIRTCDADTSPIFLCYRQQQAIKKLVDQWKETHPVFCEFSHMYDVHHRVWQIKDEAVISALQEAFEHIPALYIADGHHRTESAVKVGLEKRAAHTATPESEQFLSILFPDEELAIYEYNRVINVSVPSDFLAQLAPSFTVEKSTYQKPQQKGQFNLYFGNHWYRLTAKEAIQSDDPVAGLDVSLLQEHVIAPIFGITDVRTDKRIDFVGGIRGAEELVKRVDSGEWQIAVELYPTQMADLLSVADANQIMPPKSTWFEPKLLSGLFVYDLKTKK